jgi:hypothetical protein
MLVRTKVPRLRIRPAGSARVVALSGRDDSADNRHDDTDGRAADDPAPSQPATVRGIGVFVDKIA